MRPANSSYALSLKLGVLTCRQKSQPISRELSLLFSFCHLLSWRKNFKSISSGSNVRPL